MGEGRAQGQKGSVMPKQVSCSKQHRLWQWRATDQPMAQPGHSPGPRAVSQPWSLKSRHRTTTTTAGGFYLGWQATDEILTGELFLALAASGTYDPIHDGLGAWARVGFPLLLPGRGQVSSDVVVTGQLEIHSKKCMKTFCLASLTGKQSDWGQKGDLEAELRWFLLWVDKTVPRSALISALRVLQPSRFFWAFLCTFSLWLWAEGEELLWFSKKQEQTVLGTEHIDPDPVPGEVGAELRPIK